jgi:hypothetical protein
MIWQNEDAVMSKAERLSAVYGCVAGKKSIKSDLGRLSDVQLQECAKDIEGRF